MAGACPAAAEETAAIIEGESETQGEASAQTEGDTGPDTDLATHIEIPGKEVYSVVDAETMALATADVQQYTYVPYVWGAKPVDGYIYDEKNLRWGARNPDGTVACWDCSGFTQWFYYHYFGIDIGLSTSNQATNPKGTNLYHKYDNPTDYINDMNQWKPGDLFFFNDNYVHVAMYIGAGKFMHARSVSLGTIIENWPLTVSNGTADGKSGKVSSVMRYMDIKAPVTGRISIRKKDNDSGEYLSGAEFVLYEWSKSANAYINAKDKYPIKAAGRGIYNVGGNNSSLMVTGDNLGMFKVVETKAPTMYYEDPVWQQEFIISEGNAEYTFDVMNTHKTFNLVILKTDSDNDAPLEGAAFALLNDNKVEIARAESDERGYVHFKGIPKGKYYIYEAAAPKGYVSSEEYITVNLPDDASDEIINRIYKGFLGRPADRGGRDSFMKLIAEGGSIGELAAVISNSAEYMNKGRSDLDFVKDVYKALLGRTPKDKEVEGQLSAMMNYETRDAFLKAFCKAQEVSDIIKSVNYQVSNKMCKGSIGTAAVDKETGSHTASYKEDCIIQDKIFYSGLVPGKEYIIKTVIMDAETIKPYEDIKAEAAFVPEDTEGETEVSITFDATRARGKKLVIFEYIYLDDKLIVEHTDIMDKEQTIYVPDIITNAFVNGEKEYEAGEELEIVDKISCEAFAPGEEYVIEGALVNKDTGEIIGNAIKNYLPETEASETFLSFKIDSKDWETTDIVVTERLYIGDKLVAVHENTENKAQSIRVKKGEKPEKETETVPETKGDKAVKTGDEFPVDILAALLIIAGGIITLLVIKKRMN